MQPVFTDTPWRLKIMVIFWQISRSMLGRIREYAADNILIATGSVPARPPIPGLELAITSDDVLAPQERV